MALFDGLFDFPDLSDGQSELSLSSNSDSGDSQSGYSSEASENKDNAWYNMPSNSEDEDNDLVTPSFTLPICSTVTSIAFTIT